MHDGPVVTQAAEEAAGKLAAAHGALAAGMQAQGQALGAYAAEQAGRP